MMDIDAIIAEATAQVEPQAQEVQATTEVVQEVEQSTEESKEGESPEDSKAPDSELTPEQLAKREANRQSRYNQKMAKLRLKQENAELKAQLDQLKQAPKAQEQANPDGKPDITQFDDHMDYLEALADWKLDQRLKSAPQPTQPAIDPQKAQRFQELASKETELAKQIPDYTQVVYQDNAYIMNNMPKPLAEALLRTDNASLALYALAKEGRLEDLEDMSPLEVGIEVGQAVERGKGYLTQRTQEKVTNAPAPISKSGRTSVSLSPSITKMDARELVDWINS